MMENITIKRDEGYSDSLRNYSILIDGEEKVTLSQGEEKSFHLKPGTYSIQAKIDWCKTPSLNFEVNENQGKTFLVESNLRGYKKFLACLYIFMPSKWLKLKEIENKTIESDLKNPSAFPNPSS